MVHVDFEAIWFLIALDNILGNVHAIWLVLFKEGDQHPATGLLCHRSKYLVSHCIPLIPHQKSVLSPSV